MAIFTRIVPDTRWTALLLPNLVAGVVHGVVILNTAPMTLGAWGTAGNVPAALAIVLVPLFAWQALCARVTREGRAVVWGGAVFGLGLAAATWVCLQIDAPDGLLIPARWGNNEFDSPNILVLILFMVIVSVSAVVICLFTDVMLVRTVPQLAPPAPPRWCWKCGYDLVGLRDGGEGGGGVCPECGDNLATARPRAAWLFDAVDWLWRRRRIVLGVLFVALIGFEGWLYITRAVPVARFVRTFRPRGLEVYVATLDLPTVAYAVPLHNKHGWHVCVEYRPRMNGHPENCRLALVTLEHYEGLRAVNHGLQPIDMLLDHTQAQDVIRNGLSPEIFAAFQERGEARRWQSWAGDGHPLPPSSLNRIDPAPFFPQRPEP